MQNVPETHTQKQQKNGENTKIDNKFNEKNDQQCGKLQHDMHPGLQFTDNNCVTMITN